MSRGHLGLDTEILPLSVVQINCLSRKDHKTGGILLFLTFLQERITFIEKTTKKSRDHEKCKQTSNDNTNDHQVALGTAWEFQIQWTIPHLTDQRIRWKTNLEAARKTVEISIVCHALWQSVVQTCRQKHAYQPAQVPPLFQNHNHNHKTNENQLENSKVQKTKYPF